MSRTLKRTYFLITGQMQKKSTRKVNNDTHKQREGSEKDTMHYFDVVVAAIQD